MATEVFAAGDSLIHRLDPRIRVIVATLAAVLVALAHSPVVALGGLLLAVVGLGLARLDWRQVTWRLFAVNGLIIFLWLVLPFSQPGAPALHLGPLTATWPGVELAGLLTLKSNAIILTIIVLVATIPVTTLGQALHHLHLPDKLCHLLLFTYRYLHVLEQEYHRLQQALKVRGFVPRTGLHTYRTYAYLVAILLVRSCDRAERVYQAMLCRGFQGRFYSLRQFALGRRDIVFLMATLPPLALLAGLEWGLSR